MFLGKHKKKSAQEVELLALITRALKNDMSSVERKALEEAKLSLEKGEYLPRVVRDLEVALRPLAIRSELTDFLKLVYRKLNDPSFQEKGIGVGLSMFGNYF